MFGQGSTRFRTTDFFGIVLPGAYLVCELGLLVVLFVGPSITINEAKDLGSLWAPILVLLLFVSYLIGSVFRTWTVDDTDNKFATLFPDQSDELLGETAFPYRERLRRGKDAACLAMSRGDFEAVFRQYTRTCEEECLSPKEKEEALRDYLPPFGLARSRREQGKFAGESRYSFGFLPDVEPWVDDIKVPHRGNDIHNFWKAVLCVNTASGFEFAEATEARTRFFFGMLCAARWSLRVLFFTAAALSIWLGNFNSLVEAFLKPSIIILALVVVWLERWGHLRSQTARPLESKPSEANPRWKVFRSQMWFWVPLSAEVLLTPLLLASTGFWSCTVALLGRILLLFLLAISTALLFHFLARRLRRVRAREMGTVHVNHVELVLASYRAEKKDPA
jgi:hypothetical protein